MRRSSALVALFLVSVRLTPAQEPIASADSLEAVRGQMQQLQDALDELRAQLAASKGETEALRQEVQTLREQVQQRSGGVPADARLETLAEEQRLTAAKVEEQSQTAVISGSKYQLRLSGVALMNAFATRGAVDNMDLPFTARAMPPGESGGNLGATLRQSLVSLDVFGPRWGSAKTSAALKFDFFGGLPGTADGVAAGLVRLRTATLAFEWKDTTIVAGQDTPFFSPLTPTSLVSTAYPALSGAGNLWAWIPQVSIERRFPISEGTQFSLQGGVLDSLTGELPGGEYDRTPTAGERSRLPAYAMRLGWQRTAREKAAIGVGGWYGRQDWGFARTMDAWAFTSDWNLPFGRGFSLSGEFYRGRAIAGLGGGLTGSVLFDGIPTIGETPIVPVDSAGGWSQLKYKPAESLQFNLAFGKDAALGSRLVRLPDAVGVVHRNASGFFNVIYQPRSNLMLSIEYRRLWTSRFQRPFAIADHIGLGAGILF